MISEIFFCVIRSFARRGIICRSLSVIRTLRIEAFTKLNFLDIKRKSEECQINKSARTKAIRNSRGTIRKQGQGLSLHPVLLNYAVEVKCVAYSYGIDDLGFRCPSLVQWFILIQNVGQTNVEQLHRSSCADVHLGNLDPTEAG